MKKGCRDGRGAAVSGDSGGTSRRCASPVPPVRRTTGPIRTRRADLPPVALSALTGGPAVAAAESGWAAFLRGGIPAGELFRLHALAMLEISAQVRDLELSAHERAAAHLSAVTLYSLREIAAELGKPMQELGVDDVVVNPRLFRQAEGIR